jgi:acyl-CoA reductase-like NAD-dependent aldehyde dehydrogenase
MAKTTTSKKVVKTGNGTATSGRVEVLKTYKIYIGGKFPRTESGRYYTPADKSGNALGNICLSSRKDFRNAVVAARGAFGGWSSRAAFNRGQILYRIAEMLEGRKAQFVEELQRQGSTQKQAETEVFAAIDRLIYYSGWCDKFQQVHSSVNPVASAHFNFTVPEPMGVIAVMAPEKDSLIGMISVIAPIIAGGNTCVVLAAENQPLCAITLAEVINSSDVPGGVINILTGNRKELMPHMTTHMDVNALVYCGSNKKDIQTIKENATLNVKRPIIYKQDDWYSDNEQNPYMILNTQEFKTTWHPIEKIGGSGAGY